MSSSSVTVAAEGVGFRSLFTTAQWHELEHQALIYKYLVAGQPIPHDLVVPIRLSFESISARLFHQSNVVSGGYYSYFGKKIDPEPGRCRRTDGKKWRCSKDAYPSSKYCERHMHRGRNRSRKPVESQSISQTASTVVSANSSRSSSGNGNGSFQNLPLLSIANNKENSSVATNAPKFQIHPTPYGTSNREQRYLHGLRPEVGQESTGGTFQVLGMETNVGNSWNLMPSNIQGYESMSNHEISGNQQQHCFLGTEIGSTNECVKPDSGHAVIRPFLDDWANGRESWSELDDQRYDKSTFSTTQLSISVPTQEASARNVYPSTDC